MATDANSLELLAEVAAHLPQVVFLSDVQNRSTLYISPAVESICGVTPRQVLTDAGVWQRCLTPESIERVRHAVANLGDGRANLRVVVLHPERGRRQVDLSLWPIKDASGVTVRLVGIGDDITDDLKARERELSLNDGLLQLIASLPDGVIVYRDVVLFCNATLRERYGFDPTGMSIQAVIDKMFVAEEQPAARRRLIEAMSGNSLVPVERRLRSSDGGVHPAELRTVTIPFSGGVARATLVRDLTERRALEAELAEANTTATLGRVAAGLTHELNNPLAVLLGQLELAVEKLPVLQATIEQLQAAEVAAGDTTCHNCADVLQQLADVREHAEAAAAAARLVRSIMTDFRTLSLPSTSDPHRVSLAQVLQSTCQLVDARLPSGVQLTLQVDSAPPVLADEARLSQALAHLLVAAGLAVHRSTVGAGDLTMTLDTDGGDARVRLVAAPDLRLDQAMVHNVEQPLVGSVGLCASVLQAYGGRLMHVAREHYSGVEVR
ncbi:MAG: PAS domain S-box protein, partial [Deltaproteobacteria bacterium]|nr:PAS domain S-box protein [Deltaproteobacteria bacterium]